MMSAATLKVLFWNARSIRNKNIELFDYLVNNNIDICLICETWLKQNDKLAHSLYKCIRRDRETIVFDILPCIQTDVVENLGIRLISSDKKVNLYSIYFPGGAITEDKRKLFKSDLRKLCNISGSFVLCGDFNCRHGSWGCSRANAWGNILNEFTTFFPINILHPGQPTYVPANPRHSPSNLDIVVTNSPNFISHITAIDELDSDHLPVRFCLNLDINATHREIFPAKATRLPFKSKVCTCEWWLSVNAVKLKVFVV